jgi:hypothetical protein
MIAYKASYDGICKGFVYEVGETYEVPSLKMCERGFHACKKMVDCLIYYPYNKNFVLFEVELLGEIIEDKEKVISNKIKVVKIILPEEYIGFKIDNQKNLIYKKHSDGFEWIKEYDLRNNCVYYKNSLGFEWMRVYDHVNNLLRHKNSNGAEYSMAIQ